MGAACGVGGAKYNKMPEQLIPDHLRPNVKEVAFQATHPEWSKPDFMTFAKPKDGDDGVGRFYSARSQFVGRWRLEKNTLLLSWDSEKNIDIVRAMETEKHWKNDQTNLTLNLAHPDILPMWFAPSVLNRKYELMKTCEKNFECPICFFDLPLAPACVVRDRKRRSCPHYFHLECAKRVLMRKKVMQPYCPECGARFDDCKEIPSLIDDPRGWFQTCDADLSGNLDKDEILSALGAMLPVERDKLARQIDLNWSFWDPSGDGSIDLDEFLTPDNGLREFVIRNFHDFKKPAFDVNQVPRMETHPVQWFEYWDRDGGGSLDREEFIRAMVKTFCVTIWGDPVLHRAQETRELGQMMWRMMGLHEFDCVPFEEFVKPQGLYDTILHNHVQGTYFGEDDQGGD
jgi:hypothetical protein